MTFRLRLTLALLAIAALPLAVLGYGVRREMSVRLDADAARRVAAAADALRARLAGTLDAERTRVQALARELAGDNRFRLAIASETSAERRWLVHWTQSAMQASGFAMLLVHDSAGRILSAGHSRTDIGRDALAVSQAIAESPMGAAVVDVRTPDGTARALATSATFAVRSARYTIVGGGSLDSLNVLAFSPDRSVTALLVTGDSSAPEGAVTATTIPYVDATTTRPTEAARLLLLPDRGPAEALKASVARWILIALIGTLLLAIGSAALLGRLVSAPLVALAERTSRLDLDRLDQRFATGRTDELGALERTLDALASRLHTSVGRLKEVERAAATGELARQVNHDIKNGLTPIRNVLRHLAQTAERDPSGFAAIYAERSATLESSVAYLDALARNYARLSPSLGRGPTDARAVVLEVARGVTATAVDVRMPEALPPIGVDAVVFRRIVDNVVSNAVDALEGRPGGIIISAESAGDGAERRVRLTITDTGRGMTRDELEQAFNDFHTTEPTGTGLGLSVVRRLLADVGGSLRAESTPGAGSTFTVEIPAI